MYLSVDGQPEAGEWPVTEYSIEVSPHGDVIVFVKVSKGILKSVSSIGLWFITGVISWLEPPLAQEKVRGKKMAISINLNKMKGL